MKFIQLLLLFFQMKQSMKILFV